MARGQLGSLCRGVPLAGRRRRIPRRPPTSARANWAPSTPPATSAIPPRSRWAISCASSSSPASTPSAPCSSCPPPKAPAASASTRLSCARSCDEAGYGDVQVLSPTSKNGYADLGDIATPFMRAAWRALVAADTAAQGAAQDPSLRNQRRRRRPGLPGSRWPTCAPTIENSCADTDCQLQAHGGLDEARPRALPPRAGPLRSATFR